MNVISCAEARALSGLRVVLTVGAPGPWSEAAKAILALHAIPYAAIPHAMLEENDDIADWTNVRNAPIAMYEDELPRSSWLDILLLAERIGTGPSLIGANRVERAEIVGLSHEICGEDGLGWNRRLTIFKHLTEAGGIGIADLNLPPRFLRDYRVTPANFAVCEAKIAAILDLLSARIAAQQQIGSPYLVGSALSAADIYLANFVGMLHPLPHEVNPMAEWLRAYYETVPAVIADRLPPLVAYRNQIYAMHLTLPLDY